MSDEQRIVITGLGAVTPIAMNVSDYWKALESGKSGGRRAQNSDLQDFHVQIAAEIDFPDDLSEYFPSKKAIRRLDRYIKYGYMAGHQAYNDAGLDMVKDRSRLGALIGTGAGGLDSHEENIPRIGERGLSGASPFYIINAIPNTATAYLTMQKKLLGPGFSLNSACATSNHALGVGASLIRGGLADAMLVGGSEAVANQTSIAAFGVIMALSMRNDSPETASRPFDKNRDGFVMGEGAGALCIERLSHAKARGAHIYAELSGFGFTSDAYDMVAPHPEGEGAARCINDALRDAGIAGEDIGLINCHGTSTKMGDKIEAIAINKALGPKLASRIPAQSTKSMTGHLIGAAGAVEAIAAVGTFRNGVIHGTINLEELDPEINLNVSAHNRDGTGVHHILSNAFGFGGQNAVVVLSRYP
ncbi:MAG: beta-ketoacyl-[acyl-carrier-protein] synthase family protein, partial [Spirochaetota bacterium]